MSEEYWPRVIDTYLEHALKNIGAVLIEGSKGCGKTKTGENFSKSKIKLSNQKEPDLIEKISFNPNYALDGEKPRLIDEWQIIPSLWDNVRDAVDDAGQPGQYLLTGSSVPKKDCYNHTGTGRIARVLMRPMSLFESHESTGVISLSKLLEGGEISASESPLKNEDLARILVRGGWPLPVVSGSYDSFFANSYVESVVSSELSRVDGVKRKPDIIRKMLQSLSRNISSNTALTTICEDVIVNGKPITPKTAQAYLDALASVFVYEELPAWNINVRSKVALRSSPKRQLVDPSLAAAILNIDADGLRKDFNTFGLLFESMCIRDLRVYSQPVNGSVCYYRDRYGTEVDAVVHLPNGRWGAIEIKLGASGIEQGAANLLKFKNKIDETKPPAFLMVLTGTGSAYRRSDGVLVVPIGCLGP